LTSSSDTDIKQKENTMVRRNLMISVLNKQRLLLDELVTQMLEASPDESGDCLFCIRKAEQVSDNLKKWTRIQRNYGSVEVFKRVDRELMAAFSLSSSFPDA